MYKGVYCALCKCMGQEYGILSRMTLNYDFAFLAMLGLSVKETCAGFERQRCLFNPLKKCLCCKGGEAFSFSAAASMVMLYYKLKDNVADQTFLKSIPARLALPYAAHMRKKARKRYEALDGVMEEYIEAQGRVEAENTQSVDAAAVPTARMLSKVCAMLSGDEREKRVLSRLGYCLGRWIYLIDAADDMQKDLTSGNYNVFLRRSGITKENEIAEARKYAEQVLERTEVEAAATFDLLEEKRFGPILENIFYEGLPMVARRVFHPVEKNPSHKGRRRQAKQEKSGLKKTEVSGE